MAETKPEPTTEGSTGGGSGRDEDQQRRDGERQDRDDMQRWQREGRSGAESGAQTRNPPSAPPGQAREPQHHAKTSHSGRTGLPRNTAAMLSAAMIPIVMRLPSVTPATCGVAITRGWRR